MGQSYKIVTTNLGRTAVRFALAQGTSVKLTHMAVGDGGGQDVEPMSSMTGLVRETFRAQINEITFDAVHPDMFTAELFIPQSVGGFYIREVGLFMEDGTLFAVGSMPLTEKPDLSSGSASDLLIKIIVRVLDASTISISIDPAQVLATRDYVDRMDRERIRAAVEAHNTEQAAHDYLARKTVQIKAGTGLSGGGTLEADRTLTVKYGTAAGTACQGNDARLSNARTPTAHKDTHKTGGSDAITPTDIGAADKTIQIKAGTGLSGGGTLEADRTLTVKYGTAAGTACQGNDARLSNARTPTAHKDTHKTGGADALTPADIGAVPTTVQVIAGTGLSGGGSLAANRTLTVKYGIGTGTACQGNDARVTASEAFRLSMIGVPRYWRSTTLPAGHVWANGDLALFTDWPELKKIYDAGGFAGMLLAYNANSATIAANLGKWRPNAANPTGLYVPKLGDQFFRAWTGTGEAGVYRASGLPNVTARWVNWNTPVMRTPLLQDDIDGALSLSTSAQSATGFTSGGSGRMWDALTFDANRSNVIYGAAAEVRPPNILLPAVIYLGVSA
ncbi:phage tail protein [uncultured Bilophila sp.]|uniref:phage tail protein n=1 Tax=uncultured Bilophila sp. TaxID=529385 RepID=UPI00260F9269|nr:phage tail protein [uncultured Bilophila sp.]